MLDRLSVVVRRWRALPPCAPSPWASSIGVLTLMKLTPSIVEANFRSCRPAQSAYPLAVTKRPNADETFDAFAFRPFRLPRGGVHRGGPGGSPRANSRAVELDGAAGSQKHDGAVGHHPAPPRPERQRQRDQPGQL